MTATPSSLPDTSELVDGLLFYPVALVVSATVFPGLTLCIPGLLFVTVLILIPLVALALVLAVTATIFAAPYVLFRAVRGLRERRAERAQSSTFRSKVTPTRKPSHGYVWSKNALS